MGTSRRFGELWPEPAEGGLPGREGNSEPVEMMSLYTALEES